MSTCLKNRLAYYSVNNSRTDATLLQQEKVYD